MNHACTGKVKHKTRGDALKAINSMQKRGKINGKMKAYKCRECPFWHVGHSR